MRHEPLASDFDYSPNRLPWLSNDHLVNRWIIRHEIGLAMFSFFCFLLLGLWLIANGPTLEWNYKQATIYENPPSL